MKIIIALVVLGVSIGTTASAASFDCAKAGTLVEKAICSDPVLSGMDSDLGRAYKAALAASPSPDTLKAGQRAWLTQRNQCQDTGCLRSAYQSRLAVLQGGGAVSADSGGVTGTYTSKSGEVLVLQTGPEQIKFSVSAVYKMNTGEISGDARLNGNRATYSGEDGDCLMLFTFSSGKLEVTQEGICGMGFNVSGAGDYKRVNKAPPKFH